MCQVFSILLASQLFLVLKPSVALNSKPIVITETVQFFQPTFLSLPSCETFCEPVSSSLTKHPLNNTVSLSPPGNFIEKGSFECWLRLISFVWAEVRLIFRVLKCIPRKAPTSSRQLPRKEIINRSKWESSV